MTFDPRTRRTGNWLIASTLLAFSCSAYYYVVAKGGKGKVDDDVEAAIRARELEKRGRESAGGDERVGRGDGCELGNAGTRRWAFWKR